MKAKNLFILFFIIKAFFPSSSDSCAGLGVITPIQSRGGAEIESHGTLRAERIEHRRVKQHFCTWS